MVRSIRDAALKNTLALPNGSATTSSSGIDTKTGPRGDFVAGCDVKITAPAMGATPMPNDKTMSYSLQMDSDPEFGSPTTLYPDVLVQTGASSAGAPAASKRVGLPSDVERYIRLVATGSASGNASSHSATLELLF